MIEKDHLGNWSPEKDCCWRLTFRQPVQKPSSESGSLDTQDVVLVLKKKKTGQRCKDLPDCPRNIFDYLRRMPQKN